MLYSDISCIKNPRLLYRVFEIILIMALESTIAANHVLNFLMPKAAEHSRKLQRELLNSLDLIFYKCHIAGSRQSAVSSGPEAC
jgi:hypothetical protein